MLKNMNSSAARMLMQGLGQVSKMTVWQLHHYQLFMS